jgi:hypothetical protein
MRLFGPDFDDREGSGTAGSTESFAILVNRWRGRRIGRRVLWLLMFPHF